MEATSSIARELEQLKENSISKLDLTGKKLTQSDVEQLADVLKTNTSATKINLSGKNIKYKGAETVARALKANRSITTLDLSGNDIGYEGAEAVAEALKHNYTITTLYLSRNDLKAEGAVAVALRLNQTVTTLDLSWNHIGNENAKVMALAFKLNRTITSLYLSHNNIGDENVKAVAEALKYNRTITTLDLSCNDIGYEGAKALAEALKANSTITTLNLSQNYIYDEAAKEITEILKVNRALMKLDLSGNKIESGEAQLIADTLEHHNHTLIQLSLNDNPCNESNETLISRIAALLKRNKDSQEKLKKAPSTAAQPQEEQKESPKKPPALVLAPFTKIKDEAQFKAHCPEILLREEKNLVKRLGYLVQLRTDLLDKQEGFIYPMILKVLEDKRSQVEISLVRFKDNRVAIIKSITAKPEYQESLKAFENKYQAALELGQFTDHIARPVSPLKKAYNKDYACYQFLEEWGGLALDQFETLDPKQIIGWMIQSMEALIAIETKTTLWHTNIKPVNMVSIDGALKIIDFGSAEIIEWNAFYVGAETEQVPCPNVTLEYSPPELFLYENDKDAKFSGAELDVYRWGMSFYELIKKPSMEELRDDLDDYKGSNGKEEYSKFMDRVKNTKWPYGGAGKEAINDLVIPILAKALSYDWKDRGTFAEILASLEAAKKACYAETSVLMTGMNMDS